MITIKDIAKKLNISPSTVSRALTNKNGVSESLRDRIQTIARDLGYHPNFKARALVGGKIGVIGVVIPHSSELIFSNPFYPEILKGVANITNKFNYHVLLSFEGADSYASIFLKGLVDGIIVLSHRLDDGKISELENRNIPTVLIPGYLDDSESRLPSVNTENIESVFAATDHLIKLGHKRISFILGSLNSKFTLERLQGYKRAFEKNNIPVLKEYIRESNFSKKDGVKLMKELLTLPHPPTAVIGINDNVTIGAIQAIFSNRMGIPKEISVITIDDSEYVSDFNPPLTAIRIPLFEIGKKATHILLNLLNGTKLRKNNIILPSEFIVRGSTGVPSD
jgi:LacI family transcriptional regulator